MYVNDVFETFLIQCHISGFEECMPNNLRKLVVDYASMNCGSLKVGTLHLTLPKLFELSGFFHKHINNNRKY